MTVTRPHLREDERTFRILRKGFAIAQRDPDSLEKALAFASRHLKGKKLRVWKELLLGSDHQEKVSWLYRVSSFEELPDDIRDWWSTYMQDHPFTLVIRPIVLELQKKEGLFRSEAVERVLSSGVRA